MAAENCCACIKLDKGCLCLGAVTFLLSCCIAITAVTSLSMDAATLKQPANLTSSAPAHLLTLPWPKPVVDVTLGIVLVMCGLWMLFSVVLFIGILKSNAACVMSYFLFGVGLSLTLLVTAVLELVKRLWPLGLVTVSCTLIYIRCLGSVYFAYERLRQGKRLDVDDQRQLILDEDFEVDYD